MANTLALVESPDILSFGDVLRSELKRLNLTQMDLAENLGVSRVTVNNLINDKYKPTGTIVHGLSKVFQRPADYWLRTQYSESDLAFTPVAAPQNDFGRLSDVAIKTHIALGNIKVTPFEESLLQPASLDLRVGEAVTDIHGNKIDVSEQPYWLAPGETVLLQTLEEIYIAGNIAANVGGMARYVRQFINYGIGYEIDPGFKGPLGFNITNVGAKMFRISAGMPIITVMFYLMANEGDSLFNESIDVKVDKKKRNPTGELAKSIKRAILEKHQKVKLPSGALQHTLLGTHFNVQTKADIADDVIFSMILDEIAYIYEKINRQDMSPEAEVSDKTDPDDKLWNLLDTIECAVLGFIDIPDKHQDIIKNCRSDRVAAWKQSLSNTNATEITTIGEQTEMLGQTSPEFVLKVFNRV